MRKKKERQCQVVEILRKTVSSLSSHSSQFGIGEVKEVKTERDHPHVATVCP